MISLKSKNEISIMNEAGQILAGAFEVVEKNIFSGISTLELDRIIEQYIIKNGAFASFKGQKGFRGAIDYPACTCISINNEVIHGIPGSAILKNGDIVSIDVGAYLKGFHADAARTFAVGSISDEARKLIKITEESFFAGLKMAVPGNRLSDISGAIEETVVSGGFNVVKSFTGHGIGRELHEEPEIPNYRTSQKGLRLQPGMTFAVEPMVNCGTDDVYILDNKWTVVTADGRLSAHYENTVAITEHGPEILTAKERNNF